MLLGLAACSVFAQPSADRIRKDLAKPDQVSIELGPGPMKKVRATGDLLWYWEQRATIRRKAGIPEYPQAVVVVHGLVRYDIGDPPSYREFRTSHNTYEGIPTPSDEEVLQHARTYLRDFLGAHEHDRTLKLHHLAVDTEHPATWHTPLSFSMWFRVETEAIISDVATARVLRMQETRFYRDAVSAPWKQHMVTVQRSREERAQQQFPPDEIRAMRTLGVQESESVAQAELDALGSVEIPAFKAEVEVFLHTHRLLLSASPQEVEAYLIRMLAPNYREADSSVRLNTEGRELVDKVLATLQGRTTYARQYCPDPGVKSQQSGSMEWWNGTTDKFTRMRVVRSGGRWENGRKVDEAWAIAELGIGLWNDPDNIARLHSYAPGQLCGTPTPPSNNNNTAPTSTGTKVKGVLDRFVKP